MCLISINATANELLVELERSGDRDMIEKRLYNFAKEASIDNPARLDDPQCHMKRMPEDLKHIRKISIGRHRVYFTGYHNQCSYQVFYIKKFKQTGKKDEDDRRFQKILKTAVSDPPQIKITKN